jgi:hypothetical protein
MVDQELDALLVGALYGELGPADEARLAAHLESHPTDRTALDDMRSMRKTLVDSRFFELHFDPPPSVSAMLVQEAARRAPRKVETGDGWFMRLTRSFASHPAMAAAAMLVVVVGVAGTLYMKQGADLARPSVVESKPMIAIGSATAATDVPPSVPPSAQPAAENGIVADLADKQLEQQGQLAKISDPSKTSITPMPTSRSSPKGIIVTHHEAQPKELDRGEDANGNVAFATPPSPPPPPKAANDEYKKTQTDGPAASAPAQAPHADVATVAPTTPGAAGGGAATAGKDAASSQDTWARDQHQRVASLVRGGRCEDAAPIAVEINKRAPDYYNSYVATDRTLKQCLSYIASAVEKQEATRAKVDAAKAAKAAPAADATK